MTTLKESLVRRIRTAGAISVADYMAECLFHPEFGYYTHQEPFGAQGDFITAPDISQMFGELTAAWIIQLWQQMGSPQNLTLCEIGPGRGTWMADILRTIQAAAPQLYATLDVRLIEQSARLIEEQKKRLAGQHAQIEWLGDIGELPQQPTIIIANELLDALPVRQFVKTDNRWVERVISLDENGQLIFALGNASIDPNILPPNAVGAEDGTIFEYAPAREALVQQMAEHVAAHHGAALLIDYGHAKSDIGDTLQAVREHKYENVFANPGKADLTSHVDFEALAIAAKSIGARVHPFMIQGEFLLALGLLERAGGLGAGKDAETQNAILQAVHRLAGNDKNQMGDLFKVMCISAKDLETITPFDQASSAAVDTAPQTIDD